MEKDEKQFKGGKEKTSYVLHSTFFTKCDSCDFIAKNPSKLKSHKKCFNFMCKVCDFKTSSKKRFYTHKTNEHIKNDIAPTISTSIKKDSIKMKCEKCDYSTTAQSNLSLHQKENCFKYTCSFCEFRTSVGIRLFKHKQRVHPKMFEKELPFQCDECDKRFSHNYLLTRHQQKEHNGEIFRCNQCDFRSVVEYDLKVHLKKLHTFGLSEKDSQVYPCNLCPLKFVGKTTYRAHLFAHKIEKIGEFFTCSDCSQVATNEETLMKHIESIHFKLNYRCNFCKVTFGRLDSFRVHLVSKHEDNKDDLHKCHICQYATRRKDAMKRHLKQTHERVRVYCDFCDYSSVDMRSLKGHVEKKHQGKLQFFLEKYFNKPKIKSNRIYL